MKLQRGEILNQLEITDIVEEGKGVARHEGIVFFVAGAVPGDVVDIRVLNKQRRYYEAEVANIITPSAHRVTPFCSHFGYCGGCKWQHLDYSAQLAFKERQVREAMVRIGKLENPPMIGIEGSPQQQHYRNKLDYSAAERKWLTREQFLEKEIHDGPALGFHMPGRFDHVLDVQTCYLQPEPSNAIRNAVKKYALEHGLTFMNLRNKAGMLRSLIIRNTLKGEWMVILMVYEYDTEKVDGLLQHLQVTFPQITSLYLAVNPKANDTLNDLDLQLVHGLPYITEEMEGLQFRIGPRSFFQTNSRQSLKVYEIARDFAGLTGEELVYDLYTGTGTIANFVARKAKAVVGVEYVADAIEDAKINSSANGITNTLFYAGDMKDILTASFIEEHGVPDVIITDPPRAGMHADVVQRILESGAKKVVYVSCNPATQARDIELLSTNYELVKVQPVDMFPQTSHVESVALLMLK